MSHAAGDNNQQNYNIWNRAPGKAPGESTSGGMHPSSSGNDITGGGPVGSWGSDEGGAAANPNLIWGSSSLDGNGGENKESGLWGVGPPSGDAALSSQWSMPAVGSGDSASGGWDRSNSVPSWGLLPSGTGGPESAVWGPGDSGGTEPSQTWAQAAGKGLPPTPTQAQPTPGTPVSTVASVEELASRRESDELIRALVDDNSGWGRRTVDQTIPWDTGDSPQTRAKLAHDSNVWMNEPPNGTGVWESHYENLGERTARWTANQVAGAGGSWEGSSGSTWPDRRNSGSGWEGSESGYWTGQGAEKRRPAPPRGNNWDGPPGDPVSWPSGSESSRGDDNSNMWFMNQPPPGMPASKPWAGESSWDASRKMMNNPNRIKPDNSMRVHQVKYLMSLGFRKEEAQNSLINNNMDLDRALVELRERQGLPSGPADLSDMDDRSSFFPGQPIRGQGPPPPGVNTANSQLMRHQIMQQVRMAFNHRLPGTTSNGPAGGSLASLQQREVQTLQTIMTLQQRCQTAQQKLQQIRSNPSAMSNPQMQSFYQEIQQQMQQLGHQLNAQQGQLKVIRSQMGGFGGGPGPLGPDLMAQQMAEMKLQSGGNMATMDIPEFVPGQPWQGISTKDDLYVTPGSVRGLLTVTNDHLEKLITTDASSKSNFQKPLQSGSSPTGPTSIGGRRWAPDKSAFSSAGLQTTAAGSSWLIVQNLLPHISLDMLRAAVTQQPGLVHFQPNMYARWVLMRFAGPEEAMKALRALAGRVGSVEPLSDAEAAVKLQEIQNLATRFNLPGQVSMNWPAGGGNPGDSSHDMTMGSNPANQM